MTSFTKTKLYQRELNYILSKKALRVRGAVVISALIEGQIFYIASNYLENHGINYKPRKYQEYSQSLNILETNNILKPKDLEEIRKFRDKRNEAIHEIFKGMGISDWENLNARLVKLGRPIVKRLDDILTKQE